MYHRRSGARNAEGGCPLTRGHPLQTSAGQLYGISRSPVAPMANPPSILLSHLRHRLPRLVISQENGLASSGLNQAGRSHAVCACMAVVVFAGDRVETDEYQLFRWRPSIRLPGSSGHLCTWGMQIIHDLIISDRHAARQVTVVSPETLNPSSLDGAGQRGVRGLRVGGRPYRASDFTLSANRSHASALNASTGAVPPCLLSLMSTRSLAATSMHHRIRPSRTTSASSAHYWRQLERALSDRQIGSAPIATDLRAKLDEVLAEQAERQAIQHSRRKGPIGL
jgi:hypothetical protein